MADPVTWGVAIAAVGATVNAVGAIRQGQAAGAAADYNAKIASQNAQIADAQGEAAAQAQQRDAQRRMGAAVAAYGASGVQMSDGSPADVLADSARMAELDKLTTKYNYKLRALGHSNQAALDSASASNYRSSGYVSAAGSLLSGYGSLIPKLGSATGGGGGTDGR